MQSQSVDCRPTLHNLSFADTPKNHSGEHDRAIRGWDRHDLPIALQGVSVDATKIARSLVFLMLLPLSVGLAVKARFQTVAARLKPLLNKLSSLSLILLIVLLLVTNIRNVIDLFGTRGVFASVLFLVVGFGGGWLFGGADPAIRGVVALGTAQRNIAAALVVGGQNFDDPRVVVMVVVVAIVGLLILFPLAGWVSKRMPSN